MMSTQRKQKHKYRLSYSHEVGSSFDPDMEDPDAWESELSGVGMSHRVARLLVPRLTTSLSASRDHDEHRA